MVEDVLLNTNTKRQTLANIIDESGMNGIIHDYYKFVAAPENSKLKELYRQNLIKEKQVFMILKYLMVEDVLFFNIM